LNWYIEHQPESFTKAVYRDPRNSQWRLKIEEKKRLLTTHIFGVDIDLQAVEVSKLSLLLKVLEGETDQSLSLSQLPFGDRALPNLASNIKRGNSLISSDFSMIPDNLVRVRAFDWDVGFKDIMEAGGFDVIIGNPPYVSDIYSCSMERALGLLNVNGYLSFIVPHTWTSLESFHAIRHKLVSETEILQLVQLPKKVFQDATVETCIFNLRKPAHGPSPSHRIDVVRLDSHSIIVPVRTFPQSDVPKGHLDNFQIYAGEATSGFVARLRTITKSLGEFVEFVYGFKTADDEKERRCRRSSKRRGSEFQLRRRWSNRQYISS
jgi:Eco57I restriction-modification methylase